jgi:hypothetical protein
MSALFLIRIRADAIEKGSTAVEKFRASYLAKGWCTIAANSGIPILH